MAASNLQGAMRPLSLVCRGNVGEFVLWTTHDDRTDAGGRIFHRVLRRNSDAVELLRGYRTDPVNKFGPGFRKGEDVK